jgi:hypothetical protein
MEHVDTDLMQQLKRQEITPEEYLKRVPLSEFSIWVIGGNAEQLLSEVQRFHSSEVRGERERILSYFTNSRLIREEHSFQLYKIGEDEPCFGLDFDTAKYYVAFFLDTFKPQVGLFNGGNRIKSFGINLEGMNKDLSPKYVGWLRRLVDVLSFTGTDAFDHFNPRRRDVFEKIHPFYAYTD